MRLLTLFALCSLSVHGALFLWFRTNALIEYAQFFGLTKRMRIDDWMSVAPNLRVSYLDFIKANHGWSATPFRSLRHRLGCFAVRMLTCYACLGLWLSLVVCVAAGVPWWTLAVYGVALHLYRRSA